MCIAITMTQTSNHLLLIHLKAGCTGTAHIPATCITNKHLSHWITICSTYFHTVKHCLYWDLHHTFFLSNAMTHLSHWTTTPSTCPWTMKDLLQWDVTPSTSALHLQWNTGWPHLTPVPVQWNTCYNQISQPLHPHYIYKLKHLSHWITTSTCPFTMKVLLKWDNAPFTLVLHLQWNTCHTESPHLPPVPE